jgi:glutamyl-tRNA synthetase
MSDKIVTRFAPSPTGFMHIGGVRTALFAYLAARKTGGTFILRIEDTDKSREIEGSIAHIQESLEWLNIDWDYGPEKPGPFGSCIQSERLDSYQEYAQQLIAKGLAYPDPYTQDEIATFREQAQSEKRPFLYRNHRPDTFEAWDGTKALRLKVLEVKRYTWHDEVRGALEAGAETLDDVILIKSDGYPTYNFAHIIDDHLMGVTHVMRGDEFISSTAKFLSIYDALGFTYPKFVSLPPIMASDGKKKLGKRDGAKDILEYRNEGYLPETTINFLALIGWNPGTDQELFSLTELITEFSIEKIQKSGGAFNEEKLLWMNKEYLTKVDDTSFLTAITHFLPSELTAQAHFVERFSKLLPSIRERIHVYSDVTAAETEGEYDFVCTAPGVNLKMLQWKNDTNVTDVQPRLEQAIELLTDANFETSDTVKEALWDYAEEIGRGELLWPIRVALTGRERSPDPFVCAYILGKEETLARLTTACDKIGVHDAS